MAGAARDHSPVTPCSVRGRRLAAVRTLHEPIRSARRGPAAQRPGSGRVPADFTSSCGHGVQGACRPFALFLQYLHVQAPKSGGCQLVPACSYNVAERNCSADQREAGTVSPHQDACLENLSARGEARRECQVLGSPASWSLSFSSVTAGPCMPMALQIKSVHHLHSWLGASLLAVKARNRSSCGEPREHAQITG